MLPPLHAIVVDDARRAKSLDEKAGDIELASQKTYQYVAVGPLCRKGPGKFVSGGVCHAQRRFNHEVGKALLSPSLSLNRLGWYR